MANIEEYSNPDLEKSALAAVLQDDEVCLEQVPKLLPSYFTDENLRRLFNLVNEFVIISGTTPTKETLQVELQARYPRERDREIAQAIMSLYETLVDTSISIPTTYVIGKLVQFARARQMLTSMKKAVELLDGGKLDESIREYETSALELHAASPDVVITRGEVISGFEERKAIIADMKNNPDKYRGILTGIDEIDRVTGGLWKGELGFVFGKSGVGKSFFLLEIAYSAFLAGLNILVIPIEMPMIQWARRFDSRISHVSYDHFKWATLTDPEMDQWERRMIQVREQFGEKGAVFITHIPMGCTMSSVRVELEQYARKGTPIDLLIIDYADLMSPPRQMYSEQGELTAIFRDLKGLAGAYNIPIWTATQAKKEAYGRTDLGMEHVGYAMGKVHVSDLVVGIARSDADMLNNQTVLSIAKYRDGTHNQPILLRSNLALAMINEII